MRSDDLQVGEEYEVSPQPHADPLRGRPRKSGKGHVKLLAAPVGGWVRVRYLAATWPIKEGTELTVSCRAVLRPWADVEAEDQLRELAQKEHAAQRDRSRTAFTMLAGQLQQAGFGNGMTAISGGGTPAFPAEYRVSLSFSEDELRRLVAAACGTEELGEPIQPASALAGLID